MYKLHAALKLTLKVLVILLVTTFAVPSSNEVKAQDVNVNFDAFYNDLSPYGRWVDHERFGQVWVYNEPGFSPYYTNGRWDYSDYGWTWVSDYAWGWAPFHYGRWENDPAYGGWLWIPG
ncbi:MAG: hypothetical protein JWN76_2779, partial [Chitinophagaceae bacterium]|nr:hypothetical protein [Chitinophagaceae bacterium]